MRMSLVSRLVANLLHLVFAVLLVTLSIHLVHLAIGHILESFHGESPVDSIFNAIWLTTVALAVFDLGIIIFDEIIWEGSRKKVREFKREFTKFLIVIITALSVESLVVFFRVAKKDVTLLGYPVLAIFAVCVLVLALAAYMRFNVDKTGEQEDPVQILKVRYARGELNREDFAARVGDIQQL